MMTAQTKKNKTIRQKRTMRYFIDATEDIIRREGVVAVTIRKVADLAGYSSASIYKYFENLEHLVTFAAISSMKGFLEDLCNSINQATNPMEKYVLAIFCSSFHTFRNPNMFQAIFVDRIIEPGSSFGQYYSIFPEERQELPQDLFDTFFAREFRVRTHRLLEQCAEQGYIKREDLDEIAVFINIIFEGIIARQAENPELFNEYYHIRMVKQVLIMYNPSLHPMLEQICFQPGLREKE